MICFTLELLTDDREIAVEKAKQELMVIFGLTEWPSGLHIDARCEGDDDGFVEWEFEIYRD